MKIEDNTHWEQNKCIWIEDGDFEINIEKDKDEIISAFAFKTGKKIEKLMQEQT